MMRSVLWTRPSPPPRKEITWSVLTSLWWLRAKQNAVLKRTPWVVVSRVRGETTLITVEDGPRNILTAFIGRGI
jgi:hypothetical protein